MRPSVENGLYSDDTKARRQPHKSSQNDLSTELKALANPVFIETIPNLPGICVAMVSSCLAPNHFDGK